MNYDELLEKCQALLSENNILKEEITKLKTQLCLEMPGANSAEFPLDIFELEKDETEGTWQEFPSSIDSMSEPQEKIKLSMSLFKGRDDVYAKRWENHKKGTSGYSPVCLNEWKHGLCNKQKTSCNKLFDE